MLVTGAAGFIAGLSGRGALGRGHAVVGLDNYSKYGPVKIASAATIRELPRGHEATPRRGPSGGLSGRVRALRGRRRVVGGSLLFTEFAYDLMAENERITAAASTRPSAALSGKHCSVKSPSSRRQIVFESAGIYPTPEGTSRLPAAALYLRLSETARRKFRPGAPGSSRLPFTIGRPVQLHRYRENPRWGKGDIPSRERQLAMSHVVPDLSRRSSRARTRCRSWADGGQVGRYTYGGDLAGASAARCFCPRR